MDPNFAIWLNNRYFHDRKNGIAIECGALDGIYLSQTHYFEKRHNWKCYNIEASKRNFDRLVINRPKAVNVHYALSDQCGFCEIQLGKKSKMDKVIPYERKSWKDIRKEKDSKMEIVESITYKNLIEKWGISNLDLFVLDIEGEEVKALNGMIDCPVLPEIFVIEICRKTSKGKNNHRADQVMEVLNKLKNKYIEDHVAGFNTFFVKQN